MTDLTPRVHGGKKSPLVGLPAGSIGRLILLGQGAIRHNKYPAAVTSFLSVLRIDCRNEQALAGLKDCLTHYKAMIDYYESHKRIRHALKACEQAILISEAIDSKDDPVNLIRRFIAMRDKHESQDPRH